MNEDHYEPDELLSAYLDGEGSAAERAEVERRLATEPGYRQALEELRALSAGMASLPRHRLSEDFAAEVLRAAERKMLTTPADVASPGDAAAVRPASDQAAPQVPTGSSGGGPRQRPGDFWQWGTRLFWPAVAASVAVAIMQFTQVGDQARQAADQVALHEGAQNSVVAERQDDFADVQIQIGAPMDSEIRPAEPREPAAAAVAAKAAGRDVTSQLQRESVDAVRLLSESELLDQLPAEARAQLAPDAYLVTANVSAVEFDRLLAGNQIVMDDEVAAPPTQQRRGAIDGVEIAVGENLGEPVGGSFYFYRVVAPAEQVEAVVNDLRRRDPSNFEQVVLSDGEQLTEQVWVAVNSSILSPADEANDHNAATAPKLLMLGVESDEQAAPRQAAPAVTAAPPVAAPASQSGQVADRPRENRAPFGQVGNQPASPLPSVNAAGSGADAEASQQLGRAMRYTLPVSPSADKTDRSWSFSGSETAVRMRQQPDANQRSESAITPESLAETPKPASTADGPSGSLKATPESPPEAETNRVLRRATEQLSREGQSARKLAPEANRAGGNPLQGYRQAYFLIAATPATDQAVKKQPADGQPATSPAKADEQSQSAKPAGENDPSPD